jgi:dephospho-CoA kinase
MLVLGLTGGIASGKNSVAAKLKELGAEIIDADLICRELVEPEKPAWREIVGSFGKEVLGSDGLINRKKLGKAVFKDSKKRELLNSILHPKVMEEEWRLIAELKKKKSDAIVVVNAALLIESGNYRDVDKVVVVVTSEKKMVKRLIARDGLTEEEARLRVRAQMPSDEKLKYADYVIDNNGTIDELNDKVIELHGILQRCADRMENDIRDN